MADFKHVIKAFNGGLLEDKREQSPNHFSITKHFDTFTYPGKLVPYPKTLASNGTAMGQSVTLITLQHFLYAPNQSSYKLYGLGQNGSANAKVYRFDIDAGAPALTYWTAAGNGEADLSVVSPDVFFYYKGFIYNYAGGNTIQRFDVTEVSGFNSDWQTISYSGFAVQPVRHPSDDIAYFFDDNVVYSLDDTTWNGAVLTLPSTEKIVAATPFGNYLAIGTVTKGDLDIRSTVYLWDRDSSLTTLTERLDYGEGTLVHLASLNNKLIGVMNYYLANLYSASKGQVLIKTTSGTMAVTLNTITTDTFEGTVYRSNCIKNNRLYFPMSAPLNGDPRLGIWGVDETGKAALDTIEPAATSFDAIYPIANSWWIAHSGNGSVTYTDSTGTYSSSNPSVWESLILSTVHVTPRGTIIMNAATQKKLIGVTINTEPLEAGQSIIVKYRTDANLNNGAWTTIFTNSTVGSSSHSAINIEATGADLPTYNEIQFRVESLGGAVFTMLQYGGETLDTDKYQ